MGAIAVTQEHLARWLSRPTADHHKYSRGVVEFHTGSRAYPGAALLGVLGALHTGVGMVRYLGPASVSSLVIQAHPEVVETRGRVDAIVVGSGMATPLGPHATHRVREALSRGVPTVIDAGALDFAGPLPPLSVLTPHARELARLHRRLYESKLTDEQDAAEKIARDLGVTVLLKGSVTTVVNHHGTRWILPKATAWLATAGTGDVLAGILGALLAGSRSQLERSPEDFGESVAAGAFLHAQAAGFASATQSDGPITASDVARKVSLVVGRVLGSTP